MIYIDHSANFRIAKLFVSFSHFSFDILVLNLTESSIFSNLLGSLGEGSYGKVYQTKINEKNIAIKSHSFLNHPLDSKSQKEAQKIISNTIF